MITLDNKKLSDKQVYILKHEGYKLEEIKKMTYQEASNKIGRIIEIRRLNDDWRKMRTIYGFDDSLPRRWWEQLKDLIENKEMINNE